jgi:hypothetical protein
MGAGPASSSGSKDTQVSGYEREINKQKEKAAKDKAAADNRERGRVGSQVSTDKSRSSSTASAFSRGGGVVYLIHQVDQMEINLLIK